MYNFWYVRKYVAEQLTTIMSAAAVTSTVTNGVGVLLELIMTLPA